MVLSRIFSSEEMDSALKHFITAAEQYINKRCDPSATSHLQKQLEILIGLTSGNNACKLNAISLQMTECISLLITILSDPDVKGSIAQKILTLFQNLLQSPLDKELKTTFHLTPTLASFLFIHRDNEEDPAMLQCLEAMKLSTYEIKINYQEGYLDDLLPFLLNVIQSTPPHKLRLPCTVVLANLCRKNVLIQKWIQNMENKRSFYRCILDLITANEQGDCMLTMAALSTIASVGMNDDTGIKLFQSANIHKTFELIFTLVQKEQDIQCFAVDLMVDMLQNKVNQKNLLHYKYFNACIIKIFALPLTTSPPKTISKIYELILTLVSENNLRRVIVPLILKQYQNSPTGLEPFLVATHWYRQKLDTLWDTPIWAAKFLLLLKDFSLFAGQGQDFSEHVDVLLPIIMEDLSTIFQVPGVNFEKACRKTVASLTILESLCSHKNYAGKVAMHLTVDICLKLMETMLENQNTADTSNLCEIMSEASVEVILFVLTLMISNKGSVENMEDKLYQYLQDARLMNVLALALGTNSEKTILMFLEVFHLGYKLTNFPVSRFVDCIKRWNTRHTARMQNALNANPQFNMTPVTNLCPQTLYPRPSANNSDNGNFNSTIKNLIENMEKGLEIRDLMPSQVMEMYERKISSLEVKERHLQGLLDAKAVSLQQADQLLAQYRCRWAQRDAEGLQLRSLLQEAERRNEAAKEEATKAILCQQNVQKQLQTAIQDATVLDKQMDDMKDVNASLQAALKASSDRMDRIKAEHKSTIKFIDVLQEQNNAYKQSEEVSTEKIMKLESEAKALMKKLKDKDLKLNDIYKECKSKEAEAQEANKTISAKAEEISSLKKTVKTIEEDNASLLREVAALDSRCHQHELQIEEAEANMKKQQQDLEKAHNELEEHKKIAALICNLAGNKSS